MRLFSFAALAVLASAAAPTVSVAALAHDCEHEPGMKHSRPIVIAHRGASGYVPEHTLAAYFIAVEQGADYIEPDLVMTKDGALVARHENEIATTTDVATRPEFASRRTRKVVDGEEMEGWFAEDFTLAELKRLRARERLPELRPGNTRLDGQFEIPTLDEVLGLVRALDRQRQVAAQREGKPKPMPIGVYPETKHPSYFDALGLSMEEPLVRTLHRWGYTGKRAPVFIQSFETANLKRLRKMTRLRLVQLIDAGGKPYDFVLSQDPRTSADLVTRPGLADIAKYAEGIGVNKALIVPRDAEGYLSEPTTLVRDAHANGLIVHGWTFRAENDFLPKDFQSSSIPAALGDMAAEVEALLASGMDGFFTDHPDLGVRARDEFVAP
jgi:glycerophosphoryl diester phosphodiesterase